MLRRSILLVVAVFAGVALFLVAIGIHGLVSTAASQRYAEIGVRMTFGASRRSVAWTMMKESIGLTIGGLALGMAATVAVMPSMSALLFEVSPTDAVAYGAAALLLGVISVWAMYAPARAASRLDVMRALRSS